MFYFKQFFILSISLVSPTIAVWTVEFEPDYTPIPCMPDKKFHVIDWSNLTIISDYKTYKILINGTGKALMDVDSTIGVRFTSEQLVRGKWEIGDFQYRDENVCEVIKNPLKQPIAYYVFQTGFKQKRCPYKKGYTETFNMFSISRVPITLTSEYRGDWKLYIRFFKGEEEIDCVRAECEVME